MSKLLDLKVKLESIPAKESRKNLVSRLAQYSTLTDTAAEILTACIEAKRNANQVFVDEDFQKTLDHARRTISTSVRLRKKLTDKIEAIESSDTQFSTISEAAKSASAALRERWSTLLTKKILEFESIVKAAKDANLKGSRSLEQTLLRLRGQTNNPPKSSDAAQLIQHDLESLVDSVKTLGLEGPAGEFLVAAALGRGRAKDLLHPEVVAFIERYNLWESLKIQLG
jgi:hypothetical protein